MFKIFRSIVVTGAIAMATTAAYAQDIVFSGVSTTSDDYQLGVVWSGIARDAGISMTVVENGTVSGMRKAAQGEIEVKSEMCWIICLDAAPPRWVSRGRFVPRILRSVRL